MTGKFGFQITVNERTIWIFPEDMDAALAAAKAQAQAAAAGASAQVKAMAKAGITYGWTRGPGDEPISLGSFDDLTGFIYNSILGALPNEVKPDFSLTDEFDSLFRNLPDPVNTAVDDLTTKAIFELDGLRLMIPGSDSEEKLQFELGMMVNLIALDLELGPFRLNRLYAKFGNFK